MADEDTLDALYAGPLDDFTARRDAAAKAAKAAGDGARAAAIKALKKPSATAWACNQVARSEREAVRALLEAGQALRVAVARTVQHGEAPEMRDVMEATRAAEEPLVASAKAVLEAAGHAATLEQLRRVRETLHAAAVGSDALREELRAGRLTRDLEMPSLLDIAAGLPEVPPPVGDLGPEPEAAPASPRKTPAGAKARGAASDLAEARKAREEAAERARRAQEEERERARKEREAQMRAAAVREADRRVAEREKALAEAEIAAARAREALEDARAARRKLGSGE